MSNILICPLDWGMGHATRVQQVAAFFHAGGHKVIIAASPAYLDSFGSSVCSLKVPFRSLCIRYSSFLPQFIFILLQSPLLAVQFFIDLVKVACMVRKYDVDIVISDNRFGAFSTRARSVYITHQLQVLSPFRNYRPAPVLTFVHRVIASLYNEIWIPDISSCLSGKLTKPCGKASKLYEIGALSMLHLYSPEEPPSFPGGDYIAVLISGPEPQRSILQEILLRKFENQEKQYVFAGGNIRGDREVKKYKNITLYSYLSPPHTRFLLERSRGIICRAGYSTIMDLVKLGKSALLVPTPGQTEQEYLAHYLSEKGLFTSVKQSQIKLLNPGPLPEKLNTGSYLEESDKKFRETLSNLVKRSSSLKKQV